MTDPRPEFEYVRQVIRRESAIVLDESKDYLVEARLGPVARAAGLDTIAALVERLRCGDLAIRDRVVEAMTTNETSFFRDLHPFEALATDVLPALARRRSATRALRIWSAASSSGQEAYSIAMVARERVPELAGWTVRIVGTDIAEGVLAQAREGRYAQLEVNRGLPAPMLARYFERDGIAWRVKPELKEHVEFQRLNLVAPWPAGMRFDVVFLRNVLIYFDAETKRLLLERMLTVLPPDGYLFVGSSEMIGGIHDGFVPERSGRATWYRPRRAAVEHKTAS
jgi:chemotaxis protein methyltransferase CheR